jgi:hypothetical protein
MNRTVNLYPVQNNSVLIITDKQSAVLLGKKAEIKGTALGITDDNSASVFDINKLIAAPTSAINAKACAIRIPPRVINHMPMLKAVAENHVISGAKNKGIM